MKTTYILIVLLFYAVQGFGQIAEAPAYEVIKPEKESKATLVLFGGYPEQVDDIKREFQIQSVAKEYGVTLLLMNFNQKVWLEDEEKQALAELIQSAFGEHQLPIGQICIGGYSSGGNIAMLISNYLLNSGTFTIKPTGVFILDSPLDLAALYEASKRVANRSTNKEYAQSYAWQMQMLETKLGKPAENIAKYEKYSIYTRSSNSFIDGNQLPRIKIRLYTEPAIAWWKERGLEAEDTNAYSIEQFNKAWIQKYGPENIQLITTEGKGFDSKGHRNPHHWSIIDKKELMKWISEL